MKLRGIIILAETVSILRANRNKIGRAHRLVVRFYTCHTALILSSVMGGTIASPEACSHV